ncbi:MAG: DNA mismatch repair protein MutS [Phycisphaera sp.]|nr:MAG: DNA mismatch repair protein MutS [Phycisphaera sp.]
MPDLKIANSITEPKKLTPAMRQFHEFKDRFPGCVLLFRMGDFYEMFYEDAVEVSKAIGLTLTERSPGQPMAGVPHHQLDNYLRKLIDKGFRVAIADQVQDPKEAKGVVERAVTRVLTPGTLVDDDLLESRPAGGTLAAAYLDGDGVSLAALDVSTGAFTLDSAPLNDLLDGLSRLAIAELLLPDDCPAGLRSRIEIEAGRSGCAITERPAWHFRKSEAIEAVLKHFSVGSVEGFGLSDDDPALVAAGAVLRYAGETQTPAGTLAKGALTPSLSYIRPPKRAAPGDRLVLDATSLRALEIERTIRRGGTDGSLAGEVLNGGQCMTALGRRQVATWLREPAAKLDEITARHAAVAALVEDSKQANELAKALEPIQDIARIAARLALGRAAPRDLVGLGQSLAAIPTVCAACENTPSLAVRAKELGQTLDALTPLATEITSACVDRPPARLADGGLIRDGVDAELDEVRGLQHDAGQWLADFQQRLAEELKIPAIRVGYNKVFGYYIELTATQAKEYGDTLISAGLSRKQTLKNAERYVNDELRHFEHRVQTAEARALEREKAIFDQLCLKARDQLDAIAVAAEAIGALDALSCFAALARKRRWVRPEMVEEANLELDAARHPVLERTLADRLVPNDVALNEYARLAIITGPNMAGKSTYIRTAALLVVLAHAGSFVPAGSARIGLTDRVFTRVGADDALHDGQSTFMVEMAETAAILNNATDRSVVVLDEIGRGTSTLDGLSLARAIAERLAGDAKNPGPRTLFATHYHELTTLEEERAGQVRNLAVRVREVGDEVVFLHHVEPGRADRSYGVQVARLAGIPPEVVERAAQVLASLSVREDGAAPAPAKQAPEPQMPLFARAAPHPAVDRLTEVRIESLTPLDAFDLLRELRGLVEEQP